MALVPSHLVGSPEAQRKIPCWPNPSRTAVLLTRDVDRLTGNLLVQIPVLFAFLFAFDDLVGRVLHSIGYSNLVFLSAQYLSVSSKLPDIKLIDFQVLEIAILLSIGICGLRLLLGVIFLKQYDRFFLIVSESHRGKVYGVFILGVTGLWAAASMKQHLTLTETFLLIKQMPRAYFIFISTIWFWSIWAISASALFIIWKMFRQRWPWPVLWRDDQQQAGNHQGGPQS
jgi:hypothetical protein